MIMARSFTRVSFLVMGSLLAWLACFSAIYVLAAVACARDPGDLRSAGAFPAAAAILLLLLATAFTVWQVRRALRQRRRGDQNAKFTEFLALSLGALALLGLGLLALPALLARPACAGQPALANLQAIAAAGPQPVTGAGWRCGQQG